MASHFHTPVLLKEIISHLSPQEGGIYFDGTVGFGGHAEAILKCGENIRVVGVDRDLEAIQNLKIRFKKVLNKNLFLFHSNFNNIEEVLSQVDIDGFDGKFDGALLDLGASSYQFDEAERGFSFQKEGPLDMRMDRSNNLTAADVVNDSSEEELIHIFKTYGEERFASRIAKTIIRYRQQKPFKTTLELSNLISELSPLWGNQRIHPATRVFQALRIAVNEELSGLAQAITTIFDHVKKGGALAVISFHSLEDRIVKRTFYPFEHPCVCPEQLPVCGCHRKPIGKRITKKPVTASETEITQNPRSRSAKLRVIERVAA